MSQRRCEMCDHWVELSKPTDGRDYLYDVAGPLDVAYDPGETWSERKRERNKDLGECEAVVFFEDVDREDPVPLMVVADGSGYRAALYTRRDFACDSFEPRP